AALADQVGADDRLAVAGRERVRRAPEEGRRQRGEDHERAQSAVGDQPREAGACDAVRGLQRAPGQQPGRAVGRGCGRRRRGGPRRITCSLSVWRPPTPWGNASAWETGTSETGRPPTVTWSPAASRRA